jgi:phenylpropionate dioxygenase-like ring-hydroxylating dioxygenase large terminal subunit
MPAAHRSQLLGWVYLGPSGTEPPFPAFSWTAADAGELVVTEMVMDCNWMQVQEGSIDSSHVAILHLDTLATMGAPRSRKAGQAPVTVNPRDKLMSCALSPPPG